MNCTTCQELLVAYAEGLVDDDQKNAIENHLADCDVCRQEFESIQTLQNHLVTQGQAVGQDDLETAVLGAIVREQKQRFQGAQKASLGLRLRRTLMSHPISKIAVAAVTVAAFVFGVTIWTQSSSVALADVLAKIETVAVYMFQTSSTVIGEPIKDMPSDMMGPGTVMVSQERGYAEKTITTRSDGDNPAEIAMESYILPEQNRAVMIHHQEKMYFEADFNQDMVHRQQGQRDARAIVKQVLKCDYESLGRKSIDGIDCEGFLTTDPTYGGGLFGEVRIELWVDVDTYLPVRLETKMQMQGDSRLHIINDNFQWDIEVDAREFEPIIPEGYTNPMSGPVEMPRFDEATLIKGLQFCIDLDSPSFPKDLSMQSGMGIMQHYQDKVMGFTELGDKEASKQALRDLVRKLIDYELPEGKPSQQQMTEMVTKLTQTVQGPSFVYATLVADGKDPAYYGDVVKPGDADLVLVRWREAENQYRVIFGNLHAETVDAATLAELEAALPK